MRRTHPALFLLTLGMVVFAAMVLDELITGIAEDAEDGSDAGEGGDADAPGSIVDTVAQAGRFGALHVAIKTAGLVDTLEGEGPFTVFAPTDAAFARLGPTLDELLADPERLARILKHHIVAGDLSAAHLGEQTELTTLADTTLTIEAGPPVHVEGSGVVEPDLTASNGVVHGIDEVLTPPEPQPAAKKKSTRKS